MIPDRVWKFTEIMGIAALRAQNDLTVGWFLGYTKKESYGNVHCPGTADLRQSMEDGTHAGQCKVFYEDLLRGLFT